MQLSEHFLESEFECKCGCPPVPEHIPMHRRMAQSLEVIRFLGPIIIESGDRCPEHNAAVGGVSNSRHLHGDAVDIKIKKPDGGFYDAGFLRGYLEAKISSGEIPQGGLGTYEAFPQLVHYDQRGTHARWHYLSKKGG